jgi:hypothetical protein
MPHPKISPSLLVKSKMVVLDLSSGNYFDCGEIQSKFTITRAGGAVQVEKNPVSWSGMVAHSCNPSYSGSEDEED